MNKNLTTAQKLKQWLEYNRKPAPLPQGKPKIISAKGFKWKPVEKK